jgi:hypothetical protein
MVHHDLTCHVMNKLHGAGIIKFTIDYDHCCRSLVVPEAEVSVMYIWTTV